MPDLIIKPTATSGNKLILKDQAGGAVLTTADSGATIANATLTTPTIANMANCTFPAGHLVKMEVLTGMGSDVAYTNDGAEYNWWPTSGANTKYSPHGGSGNNTTIHTFLYIRGRCKSQGYASHRVDQHIEIEGDDITNVDTTLLGPVHGTYDYGNSGGVINITTTMILPKVTLDGTGKADISYKLSWAHNGTRDANTDWQVYADGTQKETHLVVMEVQ